LIDALHNILGVLLSLICLLQLQLALDISVENHMFQHQPIFRKVALVVAVSLLIQPLSFIQLIEEVQRLKMERCRLFVLLQHHHLLIQELSIEINMGLHDLVHAVDVALRQRHFEVSFVSACLLLYRFTQRVQLVDYFRPIVIFLEVSKQLYPLLHVLHVDVLVHVQ